MRYWHQGAGDRSLVGWRKDEARPLVRVNAFCSWQCFCTGGQVAVSKRLYSTNYWRFCSGWSEEDPREMAHRGTPGKTAIKRTYSRNSSRLKSRLVQDCLLQCMHEMHYSVVILTSVSVGNYRPVRTVLEAHRWRGHCCWRRDRCWHRTLSCLYLRASRQTKVALHYVSYC